MLRPGLNHVTRGLMWAWFGPSFVSTQASNPVAAYRGDILPISVHLWLAFFAFIRGHYPRPAFAVAPVVAVRYGSPADRRYYGTYGGTHGNAQPLSLLEPQKFSCPRW